jgi:hypothetical protein
LEEEGQNAATNAVAAMATLRAPLGIDDHIPVGAGSLRPETGGRTPLG